MKTIKELAEELGVSKQTIRNTIANLGLQSSLRKSKNAFVIDKKQETIIKRELLDNYEDENANQNEKKFANTLQTSFQFSLRLFESQIEEKDKQLEQKDKQIEQLQKLLDQQQQLQLNTQKKLDQILMIEENHKEKELPQDPPNEKKSFWKFWE